MTYNDKKVCVEGTVIIDSVQHYVKDKFVVCDESLNKRPWNITEKESVCSHCGIYIKDNPKQLLMDF